MIKRLLAPPVFDDEEKTQQAYALHQILSTALALALAMLVAVLILVEDSGRSLVIISVLILWEGTILFVMRFGRVRLASQMFTYWLSGTLLLVAYLSGGVRQLTFSLYLLAIMTGGLLLGRRTAFTLAGIGSAVGLAILLIERQGALPAHQPTGPEITWMAVSAAFVWGAVTLSAAVRATERALQQARREVVERIQAQAESIRLAAVIEQTTDTVMITDPEGRIEYVNPSFQRVTGYPAGEVLGRSPRLLKSGQQSPLVYEEMWAALNEGRTWQGTLVNRRKDGTFYSKEATTFPIRDQSGAIINYADVGRDITRRVETEQALRQKLKELTVLHGVALAAAELESEDALIERATQIIGDTIYSDHFGLLLMDEETQELIAHPSYRGLSEEIAGDIQNLDPELCGQSPRTGDLRNVSGDQTLTPGMRSRLSIPLRVGERVIGLINAESTEENAFTEADERLMKTLAGQLVTAIERVRLLNALSKSEVRYRGLFDGVPVGLYRTSPDGRILDANLALVRMLGYPDRETLLSTNVINTFLDPQERERWQTLMEQQGLVHQFEMQIRQQDGTVIWVEDNAQTVWDSRGEVLYYEGSQQDITERKRAEAELQRLKRFNEGIVQNMIEGIAVEDADGYNIFVNPAAERILGYGPGELVGKHWTEVIAPEDHDIIRAANQRRRGGGHDHYEVVLRRKDDRRITALVSGSPRYENEQFVGTLAVFTDISDLKRAEEQLRHTAERLRFLHEIDQGILEARSAEAIAEVVLEHLRHTLECTRASVAMFDFEREEAQLLMAQSRYETTLGSGTVVPLAAFEVESIRTGKVHLDRDLRAMSAPGETDRQLAREGVRSTISVALIVQGELIGSLNLGADRPDAFTDTEIEIAREVADPLAVAIQQARLFEDTRGYAQYLELLKDITQAALETGDLHSMVQMLADRLTELFSSDSCHISLWDEDARQAMLTGVSGEAGEEGPSLLLETEEPAWVEAVLEGGRARLLEDLPGSPEIFPHRRTQPSTSSTLALPLIAGDQKLGAVLIGFEKPYRFSQAQIARGEGAARHIALAIAKARLFDSERRRSEELAAVARVSLALRSADNRTEMLPVILDQVLDLLQAEGAAFVLWDPGGAHPRCELGRGVWSGATDQSLPADLAGVRYIFETSRHFLKNRARQTAPLGESDLFAAVKASVCVPLIAQGRSMGMLCLGRRADIGDREVRLLTAIADIAANAIQRATLHEETQRRLQQVQALRTIDQAITASMDLRLTLDILLDQVTSQLGVDAAAVLLLSSQTPDLERVAWRGFHTGVLRSSHLRLGESPAGRAALERRFVHVANLLDSADSPLEDRLVQREGFVTYLAVPLIAKGQVKGVLELFHRTRLELEPEWLDFMETLAGQAAIAIDNATLFRSLQDSNFELSLAYDTTLEGWSRAMELRDQETEGHSQRVTELTLRLARAMGIGEDELVHVRRGALLHDIGKMGIPDSILLKPGPLSEGEWEIMRQHPVYAYDLLSPVPYLRRALDIPYCHHERWDGTGYPRGLKGHEIPLAARVFAVVDVWDALLSNRPYRDAWDADEVLAYLEEQAGSQFDPEVVAAFFKIIERDSPVAAIQAI